MFKYFTNAISSALGFTKTESRGTLLLILIIFLAIVSTRIRISYLKNQPLIASDSSAFEWVKAVQASYDLQEPEDSRLDKSTFLPVKKQFQKVNKTSTRAASMEAPKTFEALPIKDLNIASGEELQAVHGIGPSFSERIIKYRNLLGGFADTTQLSEVYGLKPETVHEVLKHFQIKSDVTPINFNTDSIKVLAGHPYISYDLARIIVNYRKVHGDIHTGSDLKKIKALDERTFLRLKPYLK